MQFSKNSQYVKIELNIILKRINRTTRNLLLKVSRFSKRHTMCSLSHRITHALGHMRHDYTLLKGMKQIKQKKHDKTGAL